MIPPEPLDFVSSILCLLTANADAVGKRIPLRLVWYKPKRPPGYDTRQSYTLKRFYGQLQQVLSCCRFEFSCFSHLTQYHNITESRSICGPFLIHLKLRRIFSGFHKSLFCTSESFHVPHRILYLRKKAPV